MGGHRGLRCAGKVASMTVSHIGRRDVGEHVEQAHDARVCGDEVDREGADRRGHDHPRQDRHRRGGQWHTVHLQEHVAVAGEAPYVHVVGAVVAPGHEDVL